jgi:hypothetical protein
MRIASAPSLAVDIFLLGSLPKDRFGGKVTASYHLPKEIVELAVV